MQTLDFLLEVGCEELPAGQQEKQAHQLVTKLTALFDEEKLHYGEHQIFSTPRRLAVLIKSVSTAQPAQTQERQGPAYEHAFDKSGTPTLACLGFAKSCGISTDQLEIKETPKGKRVFCVVEQAGKPTLEILPELIATAVKRLVLPKTMRWGNHDYHFIRPVHWIIALFGKEVVNLELFGKQAGRQTFGHRFLCSEAITVHEPKDYALLLSEAYVVANVQQRRELIRKQIENIVKPNQKAIIDESLLEEAANLVEWPASLLCHYNPDFLKLPREVLITSMAKHLKCFPVENESGKLIEYFVVVSNNPSKQNELIIRGNEKVLNARLSDAGFFYQNDLKKPLDTYYQQLSHVVYQQQLGTVAEKTERISALAELIAGKIDANKKLAKKAGLYAKTDLVSEMVMEFPELQGTMGYYYTKAAGEDDIISVAIKEQYLPRFSGDVLPSSLEGAAVALADKIDNLVSIFGINQAPTGEKDPFALRRATLGVLRILIEKEIELDLMSILEAAKSLHKNDLPNKDVTEQTWSFCLTRIKAWYQEKNIGTDIIDAVLAGQPRSPYDFHRRLKAVQRFLQLPEAAALANANKRVSNLLKKTDTKIPEKADPKLFEKSEEKELAHQLDKHKKALKDLYKKADYEAALTELSGLKEPVDAFFENVMVMDENKHIRLNRLALLSSLHHLFSQIADISLLQ